MNTDTKNQGAKKNKQAMSSLVLGIVSIIFSLGIFAPGVISSLACVGVAATFLALLAGIAGLRAARKMDGLGRRQAILGMLLGGAGLMVSAGAIYFQYLKYQSYLVP
jgi:uncharacterized membrane protein HdeD (DUF308 family)